MANPAWCKTEQGKGCPPVDLRVLVASRESGTLRSGGAREMVVDLRASGGDRIRLTGERHSPFAYAYHNPDLLRLAHIPGTSTTFEYW